MIKNNSENTEVEMINENFLDMLQKLNLIGKLLRQVK
jgi:hypothetical protein